MQELVLVNPPAAKIVEPYYDRPDFPRTALAFLAGHLRDQSALIKPYVLDCKFDRLSFDQAVEIIAEKKPHYVGFTAMTNEIKSAARLASMLKERFPEIITIIGGVHVTFLPEETMREFPCFDYGVIGEGEETLLQLTESLYRGEEIKVPGVCFLRDGSFIKTGSSLPVPDQDSLRPAWDMFRPAKEYMIQSSRGCPFACVFCSNPGGRLVRPRTVETVLDEIGKLLDEMKPESIYFGDEIFTVKRDRAMAICQGLIDRGYHRRVSWWCQTHVNTIDEELALLMKQSNCKTVGLGIETGDELALKTMGKGTSKEKILKAINMMKKVELSFDTFFILGQPNETYASARNTINFAVDLNPPLPIFGIMVPYPGTKVWELARKGEAGYRLTSSDWDHFNKQIGNAMELTGVSRRQLEFLQFTGYIKVFIYNFRFLDFLKFVFQYRSEGIEVIKKLLFGSKMKYSDKNA